MRSKLQTFAAFANSLLPLEVEYLQSIQRLEDTERIRILETMAANSREVEASIPYDDQIDKRKYSSLKAWVEEKLEAIDVDKEYEWLVQAEVQINTDSIRIEEEKRLLRRFQTADATAYNFIKLYDVARIYRHYLHVRMRYLEHETVVRFLNQHRINYEYARLVGDKLHEATQDIIAQYTTNATESMRWEQWLSSVFFEPTLDGYNRSLALIRLIFIAYNYRRFDLLPDKFDQQEQLMREGKFYSRRILLNFYSQRLLMFARQQDLKRAAYYGYLSIRAENNDYLYYINNLAAVLLRKQQAEEALLVLRKALPRARQEHNFHNKIGHVAYICLAYNQLGQYKQSVTHAKTFFDAYKKAVFDHRWHLFFSAWMEALLGQGQYSTMLKLATQYTLEERDVAYSKSPNYQPSIPWMLLLASYKVEKMKVREVVDRCYTDLLQIYHQNGSALPSSMGILLAALQRHAPEVLDEVKGRLQKRGILLRF